MTFNAVLALLTIILGLIPIFLSLRVKRYVDEDRRRPLPALPQRRVYLILPCKGLDPGFGENIRSWFAQDVDDFEMIFAVATQDDPALAALQREIDGNPRIKARIVVAGIENCRAQKLTNQLAAVGSIVDDGGVAVFADSDIRPDPAFVRRLIAPLAMPGVGATTGFRWYQPITPNLGSMLRSTWNAGALPFLCDLKRNFAWGGAMAITMRNFHECAIAEAWDQAVSDDFPFTLAVRRKGMTVLFVTRCIAVSHEDSTLSETLEFTNRQSIISRVYYPTLWWSAALAHSLVNVLTVYGLGSLLVFLSGGGVPSLLGAACLILLPLQSLNAMVLLTAVPSMIPAIAEDLKRLGWRYMYCAPLASMMSLVNTLYSATTRKIVWRGVGYELISPTKTIVET